MLSCTRALNSGQLHGAIGSGAGGTDLGACASSRTGSAVVFLSCRSPASASLAGAVPSWPKAPTRLKSAARRSQQHVQVLCAEAKSNAHLAGHGAASSWAEVTPDEASKVVGWGLSVNTELQGASVPSLCRRAAAVRCWGHAGPGPGCRHCGSCQGRCRGWCWLLTLLVSDLCCHIDGQDVVIPVDDKGKTTTLTKAWSKSPPCLRLV